MVKVGDKIRIIYMEDELEGRMYNGREGVITIIDDVGMLHGTWGGLAIIPEEDDFEVIG